MCKRDKKLFLLILLLVIFFGQRKGTADCSDVSPNFSISPVLSENQRKEITTLIDVNWQSGFLEKIGIKIKNFNEQEQTYQLLLGKAVTNANGIIDYKLLKNTSNNSFTKLVSFPKKVTVSANSEQVVYGEIKMPINEFEGVILGGVKVSPVLLKNSSQGIANIFSYSMPIALRGKAVEQTPKLTLEKVTANQESNKNIISSHLKNNLPILLNDVEAKINVIEKGKKVPIFSEKRKITFAPEADFELDSFINQGFSPGKYTLMMDLEHKTKGNWKLSKEFEIKSEDAAKFNKQTTEQVAKQDLKLLYPLIGTLMLLLVALITVVALVLKTKRH